jgi:hypothetical protein
MTRNRPRLRAAPCVGLALLGACASARGGGALEPRFVAVHNAFAAMGLAQVGPIHEGMLAEGREARVPLDLAAGCTAVAAVGGEGLRDVDATLVDAQGHPVAHDTTNEPQALLRVCVDAADGYVLVVKASSGSGPWVVATWQGGGPGAGSSAAGGPTAQAGHDADGTCDAPLPLAVGTVTGSTAHGEHENAGSCDASDSRELVYQLDVAQRERVAIEVEAKFDSVLYLRKDDCTDPNTEVDCSDDAPDRSHSRVERVLEPGRYFVFVDGYSHDSGSFKLTVATTYVVALADECRRAPALAPGSSVSGTTATMGNDAEASCGDSAEGADAPWRMDLTARSRLRVVEHSDAVTPVVHMRRACADEQSEVACGEGGASAGDAAMTGLFDAGGYTVFADAHERDATGQYTLQADVAPPAGTGTAGDGCGDAVLLGADPSVAGDTFWARDDVASTCSGNGAADVVYRLDVPRRSRVVAALQAEEAPHVLALSRRCGDRSSEVGCGRDIDEVVAPGTYYVTVDGASEDAFGRFVMSWSVEDLSAQSRACASVPGLVDGAAVTGTTSGMGDKFSVSCAGSDGAATGPDRVYAISLPRRSRVQITLTASGFDAALAVRKSCVDAAGGAKAAELACESEGDPGQRDVIDKTLEAGTYWVVVDGQSPNDQGPFTLEYRVVR